MKASIALTLMAMLAMGNAAFADSGWRTSRTAHSTTAAPSSLDALPTIVATGVTPADDDVAPPASQPASAEQPVLRTAEKPAVQNVSTTDLQPLVKKASYVREISDQEMMGRLQTVSNVEPAARLQPVPSNAATYYTANAQVVVPPTTMAPGTSVTTLQPVTVGNPCCDPCVSCNPCQTYAPMTTMQPVAACRTGFCKNPTLRPGLWGQPSVHIDGQPIRNAFRWLVP